MIVKPQTSDLIFDEEKVRDTLFKGHQSDGLVDSRDMQTFEIEHKVNTLKSDLHGINVKDFEEIGF